MTLAEFLERQASFFWMKDEPVPIDLFARMNAAGLDVDAIERNFKKGHTHG